MKEIETCFICKLGINIEEEDLCKISDYQKGKHFKSIYAHVNCWREHMSNKNMVKQALGMAMKTSMKANQILGDR